jgi:hypothetical protein
LKNEIPPMNRKNNATTGAKPEDHVANVTSMGSYAAIGKTHLITANAKAATTALACQGR